MTSDQVQCAREFHLQHMSRAEAAANGEQASSWLPTTPHLTGRSSRSRARLAAQSSGPLITWNCRVLWSARQESSAAEPACHRPAAATLSGTTRRVPSDPRPCRARRASLIASYGRSHAGRILTQKAAAGTIVRAQCTLGDGYPNG